VINLFNFCISYLKYIFITLKFAENDLFLTINLNLLNFDCYFDFDQLLKNILDQFFHCLYLNFDFEIVIQLDFASYCTNYYFRKLLFNWILQVIALITILAILIFFKIIFSKRIAVLNIFKILN